MLLYYFSTTDDTEYLHGNAAFKALQNIFSIYDTNEEWLFRKTCIFRLIASPIPYIFVNKAMGYTCLQ